MYYKFSPKQTAQRTECEILPEDKTVQKRIDFGNKKIKNTEKGSSVPQIDNPQFLTDKLPSNLFLTFGQEPYKYPKNKSIH